MTDVLITPLEPGSFRAEITEGPFPTSHRVTVPDGLLEGLGLEGVDQELVVRETIRFLLEREPATSILPDFSLDEVPKYFPEFYDELRLRLTG